MSDFTFQEKRLHLIQVIRSAMQAKNLNNVQLANRADISESTVRKVLNENLRADDIGPHPRVIRGICQALDIDLLSVYEYLDYMALPDENGILQRNGTSSWK